MLSFQWEYKIFSKMYYKLQLFIPPADEYQEDLRRCRDGAEGQAAHIMQS